MTEGTASTSSYVDTCRSSVNHEAAVGCCGQYPVVSRLSRCPPHCRDWRWNRATSAGPILGRCLHRRTRHRRIPCANSRCVPGGGIWRICAVIDYATKYCLAAAVTPTARGRDALACLYAAVAEAQRLLDLDDLRADRGALDLVDETTGEALRIVPAPIAVVSDNGSLFPRRDRSDRLRRRRSAVAPRPHSCAEPADQWGGGAVFGTLKYEPLYRAPIDDGDALGVEINLFRHIYNTIRPHQTLDDQTPRAAFLENPGSRNPVRAPKLRGPGWCHGCRDRQCG